MAEPKLETTLKTRRVAVTFSGVGKSEKHDGRMNINHFYMLNTTNTNVLSEFNSYSATKGYVSYEDIFGLKGFEVEISNPEDPDDKRKVPVTWKDFCPVILNYKEEENMAVTEEVGMYSKDNIKANNYSIYRREYEVFGEGRMTKTEAGSYEYATYSESKGQWSPVVINSHKGEIRDFNVKNDRTYQYILYPSDYLNNGAEINGLALQIFANYDDQVFDSETKKFIEGSKATAWKAGSPVSVNWGYWSIIELVPEENEKDIPVVKKTYKANLEQLWVFKYDFETGAQTQNISRNEFTTLGQFPKIGYGQTNYVSGEVSALLGSEIRPYRGDSYVERLWMNNGRDQKIVTTNEKVLMLDQWRKFVSSPNPKLLKDTKGQSWIVQIMSNSNTPKIFIKDQPDSISFTWKQIESTDNVIIYGDITTIPSRKDSDNPLVEKVPIFKNRNRK